MENNLNRIYHCSTFSLQSGHIGGRKIARWTEYAVKLQTGPLQSVTNHNEHCRAISSMHSSPGLFSTPSSFSPLSVGWTFSLHVFVRRYICPCAFVYVKPPYSHLAVCVCVCHVVANIVWAGFNATQSYHLHFNLTIVRIFGGSERNIECIRKWTNCSSPSKWFSELIPWNLSFRIAHLAVNSDSIWKQRTEKQQAEEREKKKRAETINDWMCAFRSCIYVCMFTTAYVSSVEGKKKKPSSSHNRVRRWNITYINTL